MVSAGKTPREALREVTARLTEAGCPDAAFDAGELLRLVTGQDPRLSEAPLTGVQAARLEELTARRAAREPLQYLCGSWPFLDFELAVGPTRRWWRKLLPGCWPEWKSPRCWTSVPGPVVSEWGSNASARRQR